MHPVAPEAEHPTPHPHLPGSFFLSPGTARSLLEKWKGWGGGAAGQPAKGCERS